MRPWMLLVLGTILGVSVSGQELRIGALETLKPFEPLFRRVLEEAGFRPTFVHLPQARVVAELEAGTIDGNLLLSATGIASARGAIRIPVMLSQTDYVAVAASSEVRVRGAADLPRYRVGIERGNTIHEGLARGAREIIATAGQAEQFRMLAAGRFDVAISTRSLVTPLARGAGLKQWWIQEPPLGKVALYFSLSAQAARHEAAVTRAFQRALEAGWWTAEYRRILGTLSP